MKIATKLFIYILLFLAFFIRCKEDIINEPVILKFNIEGVIISTNSGDGISNIILTLEGSKTFSDTTNETGNYSFYNTPEGDFHLFINNTMFEQFDTVITINKDTVLNFYLVDKVSDYFPLELNNEWNYLLTTRNGDRGYYYDYFDGEENWRVTNINKSSDLTIYKIQLERNGIIRRKRTINDNGNPVEVYTSDTINVSSEFTIVENINHFLQINHPYFSNLSRQRYFPILSDNLITIGDVYAIDIERYEREIGLVERYYNRSSNAAEDTKRFVLIR